MDVDDYVNVDVNVNDNVYVPYFLHRLGGLLNQFSHRGRLRNHWHVAGRDSGHSRLHALGKKVLAGGWNHLILFGDQIPR